MWDLVRVVRNTPWDFEIGDPTPMGWLTVALYFACASVCSWNAVQSYRAGGVRGRPTAFWTGLALAMTLLGINKQLDIQSWFTAVGRGLAEAQGWYEQRRAVQAVFVGAGVLLGLGIGGAAAYVWRHSLRKNALAWLGLLFVGAFVVTRAASFHHVDRLLGLEMLGVRVNWVLEIGGILIVCAGAISSLRRDRATLRPPVSRQDPRLPRARAGLWLFGLAVLLGIGGRTIPVHRPFDQRLTSAWRESDYVQVARNFDREGLNPAYPKIDWRGDAPGYVEMEFPFLPWAGGLLYRGFEQHVQFMRALAALVSLGALWLFYRLSLKLLAREAALYAAALFSVNWMVIELGTALQPDGLMVFLSILTVYLTWNWWSEPSTARLLAAAMAASGAILAKAPAATLGFVLAYAVLTKLGRAAFRTPAVYAAAALAIVPPLIWHLWTRQFWLVHGNSLGLSNETHLVGLDMLWPPTFLAGILKQETLKVLTPFGWIALLAAVPVSRPGVRLAWIWYGTIWLFFIAAGRTTGDSWAFYYHAIAVPPAYLLVGAGIENLLRRASADRTGFLPRRWGPPLAHALGVGTALSLLLAGAVHLKNLQASWDGPMGEMYACAIEMTDSVPVGSLIVTSGTSMFDEYGKPVAYNMPMFFAWMDRRGFSYGSEDLSFETLDALATRGGRYWIATWEELTRLGGRGAAERRYTWLSDCRYGYSVFDLRSR